MSRHLGSENIAKQDRDMELYRKFREVVKSTLDSRGYVSTVEAIDIARNCQCSCYFVSYERAYKMLITIERHNNWHYSKESPSRPGNPLRHMKDNSRTMFLDMYREYEKIRKQNPNETRLESTIKVCDSPARQFYLSFSTARQIIQRLSRKFNENIKQCNQ